MVKANGLDLSLFQFDFDLTWAVIFMNADKSVYGRYGSRSERDAMHDISAEGFKKAALATLDLHKGYPANKAALAGKSALPLKFTTPEKYPSLAKFQNLQPTLAKPKQGCMHCHMIHDAQRQVVRSTKTPLSDDLLYLYPQPDWLGLAMDPQQKATAKAVAPGSPAEKDGFKAGDEIVSLEGQPIISTADIQWILQNAKDGAKLKAQVKRGGETKALSLSLANGWRKQGTLAWRTSSWSIRQWGGGMFSESLGAEERAKRGLAGNALALFVKHVGQYAPHNIAQRAGLKKDDVIVEFDGLKSQMTESELLAYIAQKKKPGDNVALTVLRGGQPQKLQWVLPEPKQ